MSFQLVGTAYDAETIAVAINERRKQLGLTMSELDFVAGLTGNYASKILSPTGSKRLGQMSLPSMLGALGLKLAIVASDDELPAITRRALTEKTVGPNKIEAPQYHSRPTA